MIKNITYGFTFILAILVGTLYFHQFNLDYNANITVVGIDQVLSEDGVILSLHSNPGEVGQTADGFIDAAKQVIEQLQLPASLSVSRLSENQRHTTLYLFLTSDTDLITHVHLESDQSLQQVMQQPTWHITNNPEIENAVLIDYLDNNYYQFDTGWKNEISMYSLNQAHDVFPDQSSQLGLRVLVKHEDVDDVKKILANGMSDFIYRATPDMPIEAAIYEADHKVYSTEYLKPSFFERIISIPYSIVWLSMLCMLFISIYVSINQAKEIMIGYLHGYTLPLIIRKYFLSHMIVSTLLFVAGLFGTSYILSSSHGSLYIRYVLVLLPFVFVFVGFMFVSFVLTYFWVKVRFSSEILKESKQFKIIYALMSILKCGIVLAICIPLLQEWNDVLVRKPYLELYKTQPSLQNGVSISFSGLNHNVVLERAQLVEEVSLWVAQDRVGYADFHDYIDNHLFDSIKQEEMRDPFFLTSNGYSLLKEPYLIVNTKYLLDTTGMDFEKSDEVRFVLPQKFEKDSDVYRNIASQSTQEIKFYNEELVFAPHFETGVEIQPMMGVMVNPILIIDQHAVEKARRFEGKVVVFHDEKVLHEMINELEAKYPTTFNVQTVDSSFQRVDNEQSQSLATVIQFVFMYVILLLVFVFTSTSVFINGFANELVIQYMNGYGYFKRYKTVFALTMLISAISFAFVMYLLLHSSAFNIASWMVLLIATIGIDVAVVMSMIYIFEHKNMAMILKGDI